MAKKTRCYLEKDRMLKTLSVQIDGGFHAEFQTMEAVPASTFLPVLLSQESRFSGLLGLLETNVCAVFSPVHSWVGFPLKCLVISRLIPLEYHQYYGNKRTRLI